MAAGNMLFLKVHSNAGSFLEAPSSPHSILHAILGHSTPDNLNSRPEGSRIHINNRANPTAAKAG